MKKNYYSIHKNKKKRKSIETDFQKVFKKVVPIIIKSMRIVQFAIELSQRNKRMPIPKYKLGSNSADLMIVNDSASRAGSNPERILFEEFKNRTFEM